jgi:hypothetical protein
MALAEERVTHWNREAFLRDAEGKRSVAMPVVLHPAHQISVCLRAPRRMTHLVECIPINQIWPVSVDQCASSGVSHRDLFDMEQRTKRDHLRNYHES